MKAERRHELQHNELADWLAATLERLRPYWRAILGVTIAALVLLAAYYMFSSRAQKKQSVAWDRYLRAISAATPDAATTDLEETVERYSKTPAAVWAEATLADVELADGISLLFVDKNQAEKKIKSAIGHYEAVRGKADEPLLKARILFGLARAQESLGDLKEAAKTYEALVDLKGSYQHLAEERVAALSRDSTHDFYAWFAKEEPVRTSSSLPGSPGDRLPFDASGLVPDDLRLTDPDNLFKLPSLDGPALPSFTSEFGTRTESKDKSATDDANKDDGAKTDDKTAPPAGAKAVPADSKDAARKDSPPADTADNKKGEAATDTGGEPKK
jgi:predicted negative regulator of RcsB-dependent stress response